MLRNIVSEEKFKHKLQTGRNENVLLDALVKEESAGRESDFQAALHKTYPGNQNTFEAGDQEQVPVVHIDMIGQEVQKTV